MALPSRRSPSTFTKTGMAMFYVIVIASFLYVKDLDSSFNPAIFLKNEQTSLMYQHQMKNISLVDMNFSSSILAEVNSSNTHNDTYSDKANDNNTHTDANSDANSDASKVDNKVADNYANKNDTGDDDDDEAADDDECKKFMSGTNGTEDYEQVVELKHPTTIVIGTQKGGTSALSTYLAKFPDVVPSKRFEPHFFDNFMRGREHQSYTICDKLGVLNSYQNRVFQSGGINQLKKHPGIASYEKTPIYIFNPDVADRIKTIVPWAKLILLLRDPIDRAFSHFRMSFERHSSMTFESCVETDIGLLIRNGVLPTDYETMSDRKIDFDELEEKWRKYFRNFRAGKEKRICDGLVARGMYSMQLYFWKEAYGEKALLGEKLLAVRNDYLEPNKITHEINLKRISDFMNMTDIGSIISRKIHQTTNTYKGKVSDEVRTKLQNLYRPFDRELSSLLGSDWEQPWSYS